MCGESFVMFDPADTQHKRFHGLHPGKGYPPGRTIRPVTADLLYRLTRLTDQLVYRGVSL
jgi:hypothetical protein